MNKQRRKNFGIWCVAFAVIGFVVYPLSLGLWIWYCVHVRGSVDLIYGHGFYSPLMWLSDEGPRWIGGPYSTYLRWWLTLVW